LVYTFAGSGCTHYLKEIAAVDKNLTYINSPGQQLGKYNLLDLTLSEAVLYIRQVSTTQKYLLVVSSGTDFHSTNLESLLDHFYLTYPLPSGTKADIEDMISRFSQNKTLDFLNQIITFSGGIPKLAKYLITHDGRVDNQDPVYQNLLKNINDSVVGYSPAELKSLSLVDDQGNFISKLLSCEIKRSIDIKINFDLSFEEKGIKSTEKLTPLEAKIINKIIENGGQITKSEVSDIKWGEGKYDEFSDQAINKQIRRLSQKLQKFQLITIPKVGFELK